MLKSQIPDYEPPTKLGGVIMAMVGITMVVGVISYVIPKISSSSDEQVALAEKKVEDDKVKRNEDKLNKTISEENQKFGYSTQLIDGKPDMNFGKFTVPKHLIKMTTNYGDLKINVNSTFAPQNVENFVRLASRNYYKDTIIHRLVKGKDFTIIQGGDKEKKNGTGGQSAFYVSEEKKNEIPDENWKTKPEFSYNEQGEPTALKNNPEFMNPNWYKDFNKETGEIEYPKGLILMANIGPNSGNSQFFITLDKTILPAQYTVFGEIPVEDFGVLDKIQSEVNPTHKDGETLELLKLRNDPRLTDDKLTDGLPDKLIQILGTEIVN